MKPIPGNPERAEGVCPTVRGDIAVAWRRAADGTLDVEVNGPRDCAYEIITPEN